MECLGESNNTMYFKYNKHKYIRNGNRSWTLMRALAKKISSSSGKSKVLLAQQTIHGRNCKKNPICINNAGLASAGHPAGNFRVLLYISHKPSTQMVQSIPMLPHICLYHYLMSPSEALKTMVFGS
uniref:Uncharacterized protein n=1 Tax=Glossina palpalis gambiensis TaxID=67801 RepID=A0A1B0BU82_9MUSC